MEKKSRVCFQGMEEEEVAGVGGGQKRKKSEGDTRERIITNKASHRSRE